MSQTSDSATNLFTYNITDESQIKNPTVDLLRNILHTRLEAEMYRKQGKWQYYSTLMSLLFDVTRQFTDLSHALDLIQDFSKQLKDSYPKEALEVINQTVEIYRKTSIEKLTIATRFAFSRLKMQAATLRLEYFKSISLADIRAELYHPIPIIHELNFIIVLIKTKNYLKANLFLAELEPLFSVSNRVDIRLALPYYELATLGHLGQNQKYQALEALDHGYELAAQLPKLSFQATRFMTFFEKVMHLFESIDKSETTSFNVEDLIVPGYIFDKIFLHTSMAPDPDSILVEFETPNVIELF